MQRFAKIALRMGTVSRGRRRCNRISDPRFHSPWGPAFKGYSLLVTNGDLEPAANPDAWKIFKVYVGETGLPLNRPKTPGG